MTAINASLGIPFPPKRDHRRYYYFDLRIGTLVLLWISLILTSCASFVLLLDLYKGSLNLLCLVSFLACGPISYALGLYGVYERKPSFLLIYVKLRLFEIVRFWTLTIILVVFWVCGQELITFNVSRALIVSLMLDPHFLFMMIIGRANLFPVDSMFVLIIFTVTQWCCYKMVKSYHSQLKTEIILLRDGFSLLESAMKKPYNVTTYNIV